MYNLHIQLLGDMAISNNDEPITSITSPRLQSFFAYLLLHRVALHPRQELAFLFWSESSESQSRTNLRKLLFELRRALPDVDQLLYDDGQAVGWRRDAELTLDVEIFEEAVSQAKTIEELKQAVALYRGELLPNCYDDWILDDRQRLFQLYIEALERLVTALEDGRDYRSAIHYAQRLLTHAPLQEDYYRMMMRLHALSGNRAGIMRTYHVCVTTLQRELNVMPSDLTQQTYRHWLQMDIPLSQSPVPEPRLVGRTIEWTQLQAAWRGVQEGHPRFVLISGEEGVGKTRLAEEFARWVARQGITTASAQCYPSDRHLAYATVTTLLRAHPLPALDKVWMTEIARLLPEILVDQPQLPQPAPLNEAWQLHRFYEALAKVFLANQPTLIAIDDIQWCDPESLEWIAYLLRFDPKASFLFEAVLQQKSLGPDHPLNPLLKGLRHNDQLVEIHLNPLSEMETLQLAKNTVDHRFDPEHLDGLFQETKGNPFYTLEMLRSGWAPSNPEAPQGPGSRTRNTIENHLAQLSPAARHLMDWAATIGRDFTPDVLQQAGKIPEEELVRGLDELWQQKIVREQAVSSYDFSHPKISEAAYANLDVPQRKELHRKVAEALESIGEGSLDLVNGEIARHYELAGLLDKAVFYYLKAGDAARKVYANRASIGFYQRAIALMPEDETSEAALKLGEVWMLVGNWTEAEALYRQALRLAQKNQNSLIQARCAALLGEVLHFKGAYREAVEQLQKARSLFEGLQDQAGVSQSLGVLGRIYYSHLDYAAAQASQEEHLSAAEKMGDQEEMSRAHESLGMIAWRRSEYSQALTHFQQQLQVAAQGNDLVNFSNALGRIGQIYWAQGQPAQALPYFEQELQIAEKIEFRLGVGYAMGNLGSVYRQQGELPRALTCYLQQLRIASSLGDRRLVSHALLKMGRIYSQCGQFSFARDCLSQSLNIALEIDTYRTTARALGSLAVLSVLQGRQAEAEALFEQVQTLLPAELLPYDMCEILYEHTLLHVRQADFGRAGELNHQVRQLASQALRMDIALKSQVLEIQIETRLQHQPAKKAILSLKALLEEDASQEELACVHEAIWRLSSPDDPDADAHRQKAAGLYRSLYQHTPSFEYRQAYHSLTGKQLPEPAPLPEHPQDIPQDKADLPALMARVRQIEVRQQVLPTSPRQAG